MTFDDILPRLVAPEVAGVDWADGVMVPLLLVADAVVDGAVLPVGDRPMNPEAVLAVEEVVADDVVLSVEDRSEEVADEDASEEVADVVLVSLLPEMLLASVELDTSVPVVVPASEDAAVVVGALLLPAVSVDAVEVDSEDTAVPICRRCSRGWLSGAEMAS